MGDVVQPTKRQKELLTFIEEFIAEHGYSPSYREIMTGKGYTSVASVALHVNSLISRGHLRKRGRSARSLEVVKQRVLAPKPTEEVAVSDERWLVDRVNHYFTRAEEAIELEQAHVDALYVLVGALRVLELDAAANSFMPRLKAIRQVPVKRTHKS